MVNVSPPEDFLDQLLNGAKWVNPDRSLTKEARYFLENLHRHNNQMYDRSGGNDDAIEDIGIRETYPWPNQEVNNIQVYNAVTTTIGYTAEPFDFVNAKQESTVKFPQYPAANDAVIIRNGDGSAIPIDGNGKNINGSPKGVLRTQGTTIFFLYFIDSDEWFAMTSFEPDNPERESINTELFEKILCELRKQNMLLQDVHENPISDEDVDDECN